MPLPTVTPPIPQPGSAQPPTPDRPVIPEGIAKSFDEAFPDDGMDNPPDPVKPEPSPAKTPDKTTPPDKPEKPEKPPSKSAPEKPEKPEKGPEPGTPEKSSSEEGTSEFSPPQVAKPSELRSWANRMGERAKKAESKISTLEARLAQVESQPSKQSEDVSNMAQELAATKKKLAEYEDNLRLTKYERSAEYLEKFQKPYQDAVAAAYRDVQELLVSTPDPQNPENVTEREATAEDFNEVYALPLGQATRLAKQKFGDAATIVLQHRAAIRRLAETAFAAVEDYKKKGLEAETQTKAQQAQQEQAMQRMFDAASQGHAKKFAELLLERDGDQEGNDLLVKGRQFAQSVFAGNDNLSPQQIVTRDAVAFNRLAAYPRLVRDNKKLKMELEELKSTLAEVRGSGPGTPPPSGPKAGAPPSGESWEEAFDRTVK